MIQSPVYWGVLAASVAVFWLVPAAYRLGLLAVISFGYLASLEPVYVSILLGWAVLFYKVAPLATSERTKARWVVPGLILAILTYLAFFKYVPPLVAVWSPQHPWVKWAIPLGISYLTFKLIHYVVEVGRGNIKDRSFANFACYIFLFPIFTAGPIERFDHFLASREERLSVDTIVEGLTRIAHGLIKKFVFAEMVLAYWTDDATGHLVATHADWGGWLAWRFMIVSYLTMYMDFSAYSDIAIGASRLFGLRILENFNWPLGASNISDFWKRWHMTLANWCMAYVYMPVLGLRRNPYIAAYATFIVMGLWHAGALNWVIWGAWHATGLVTYQSWGRYRRQRKWAWCNTVLWRWVATAITFGFVTMGFVFTLADASDGIRIVAKMLFLR